MKTHHLLPLALALSTVLFSTACDREADVAPAVEPAIEPMPAAVEPAPEPMPEPAAAPVDSGMAFADMDKNSDGGITPDELATTEMLHQHFSVADTDGDGKLTSAEVDAHRASMAAAPATE